MIVNPSVDQTIVTAEQLRRPVDTDSEVSDVEDAKEPPLRIVPETGLPYIDEDTVEEKKKNGFIMAIVMTSVPRLLGLGIAILVYFLGKDKYDSRMQALMKIGFVEFPHGFLYLSIGAFSKLVTWSNWMPMTYKPGVFPGNAGNLRSNMFVYRVNYTDGITRAPATVLEDEGHVGYYNRANRALYHLVENGMAVLANIAAAGVIFGEAVFCLTLLYTIFRTTYQYAYTQGGYGFGLCKHAYHFMIHSMLLAPAIEGLVWVAAGRFLMYQYGFAKYDL